MTKFDVWGGRAVCAISGVVLLATLAACGGGGGGNAGTPVIGPGSGSSGNGSGSAVAADLSLILSASNIDNSGSKTVIATVTAVDSKRNTLANVPVQLLVADSNDVKSASVQVSAAQTDANGQVSGTVSIGQDRTNRTVTVTATSGSLTKTAAFSITGTRFTRATAVPSVVAAGAAGTVQYTLADVNGNPMAGVSIKASGTGGVPSQTGTTDQNGGYVFNYTAPNSPGSSVVVSAAAGGAESAITISIPGGGTTVPTAGLPTSKTLNLSANVVAVNTSSTSNQVTANAFFRDASNAPVKNVRVLFGVMGDNGTGSIASGNNAVLSDATGTASTTYAPGAVSSPTNGVTIKACWKTSDFTATETIDNCPNAVLTTALTIVDNPVSISIGHNGKVDVSQSLTYRQQFVVLVVDSAGNPKPDVQITPSVDLGGYYKGTYTGSAKARTWSPTAICPNEDLNRNGVIDVGEDVNNNAQLDPRKSDVSIQVTGSTKTDASGLAILQLEYPKSVGSWVLFKITVTAAGVLSPPAYYPAGKPVTLPSQSISALSTQDAILNYLSAYDVLSVPADDATAEAAPAFVISPYGTSSSCTSGQ